LIIRDLKLPLSQSLLYRSKTWYLIFAYQPHNGRFRTTTRPSPTQGTGRLESRLEPAIQRMVLRQRLHKAVNGTSRPNLSTLPARPRPLVLLLGMRLQQAALSVDILQPRTRREDSVAITLTRTRARTRRLREGCKKKNKRAPTDTRAIHADSRTTTTTSQGSRNHRNTAVMASRAPARIRKNNTTMRIHKTRAAKAKVY